MFLTAMLSKFNCAVGSQKPDQHHGNASSSSSHYELTAKPNPPTPKPTPKPVVVGRTVRRNAVSGASGATLYTQIPFTNNDKLVIPENSIIQPVRATRKLEILCATAPTVANTQQSPTRTNDWDNAVKDIIDEVMKEPRYDALKQSMKQSPSVSPPIDTPVIHTSSRKTLHILGQDPNVPIVGPVKSRPPRMVDSGSSKSITYFDKYH